MKKFVLFAVFFLFLGNLSFAEEEIPNPHIDNVEIKEDIVKFYGSGFAQYDKLKAYWEDYSLDMKKYGSDTIMDFENISKLRNGKIYLDGLIYNTDDDSSNKSNKLYISQKTNTYIKNVGKEYVNGKYRLKIYLENQPKDLDYKLFINNEEISKNKIIEHGNILKVDYDKYGKTNWMQIYLKIGDKYTNTYYYSLDNNLTFDFQRTEKEYDILKVYFRIDRTENLNVYINEEKIDSNRYRLFAHNLILNFDLSELEESQKNVYISKGNRTSKTVILSLDDYLKPNIQKFEVNKNMTGSENTIRGRNFLSIEGNFDLYINKEKYIMTGKSYNHVYENIKNKYDGQISSALGDEKEELREEKQEEIDELSKYVFDAEFRRDRITFSQPVKYKIGETNSLYLKHKDYKSNVLDFEISDSKDSQNFDANIQDNLLVEFEPAENSTGTNEDKSEYDLGKVKFLSGEDKNYFINSINFKIDLKNQDVSYLPIKEIRLGKTVGNIEEKDGEYIAKFENIFLEELESKEKNFKIVLSDNFDSLNIQIIPLDVVYNFLSAKENSEKYEEEKIDIKYSKGLDFAVDYIYSPCFDSESDYSNCKELGYSKRSHMNWSIGGEEISFTKDKEEKENNEEKQEEIKGSDEKQEEKEQEKEKNTSLTDTQKQFVLKFIGKIDEFVNKKTSSKKAKAEIYKKVYNILYDYYKGMDSNSNLDKRNKIKGILILTKSRYDRFK